MKSQSFRRQSSSIRGFKETPKKKTIKWEKVIYAVILTAILIYFLRYLYIKNFLISANGQVHFDKLDIQFTEDVRLDNFIVNEGDSVHEGDSLLIYTVEDLENSGGISSSSVRAYQKEMNNIDSEKRKLYQKVKIAETKLKQLKKYRNKQRQQAKKVENQIYLDIHTAEKLTPYTKSIDELGMDIQVLQEEINTLWWLINTLEEGQKISPSELLYGGKAGSFLKTRVYRTPVNGVVTRIFKENHEVAIRSEVVMTINQPKNVFIKAFFEPEDIQHFKSGDKVTIKFPDNQKSLGIITKIHTATYELPSEFQKKYEPVHRSVAVDIAPIESDDLNEWRKFYKMGVEVTKLKYFD